MWRMLWSLLSGLLLLTPAAADTWKAGVAKEVITPPKLMWMSGYASRDHAAEDTEHDLWAKALVVADPAGKQAVIVTLDLIGLDRETAEAICGELKERHQLERHQIALCSSHTHCGPVVRSNLGAMYSFSADQNQLVEEYGTFLRDRVVKAVTAALANLEPAVISQGSSRTSFAVNRRNNREPDVPTLRDKGELVGPVDHDVPVLAVRKPDGALKAVLFGYACHATTLSYYKWCGDWPGFAQIAIEKQHPGAVAMFWAGCGADQNPLPRRTVELAEKYGQSIAAAVDEALNDEMQPLAGGLTTRYREIPLAFGELPTAEQVQANLQSENKYEAGRAKVLLEQLEKTGKIAGSYPYPVQLWELGSDVQFVILGGEVVVDYAVRIKEELKAPAVWVAGYSNDVMAYIPSLRVLKEGGYEGAGAMVYYGLPGPWSADVEEHILKTVHELAGEN